MTFSYKTLRQITFDLQLVSFTFRFVGCTVYLLMAFFLSQALAQTKAIFFFFLIFNLSFIPKDVVTMKKKIHQFF